MADIEVKEKTKGVKDDLQKSDTNDAKNEDSKPTTPEAEKPTDGDTGAVNESEGASSSWTGWFTSTLNTAKERSTEMYQYIRQDLSEFGETVQEASRDLKEKLKLEENARSAVCTVGDTMNTILDQVSTIFGVGPDDEEVEEILVGGTRQTIRSKRTQEKIYALALEERVFLEDAPNMDDYELWAATFDLDNKECELADLLTSNPHLQLQYTQLVPEKVSHLLFWHRFYYQVYLILKSDNHNQVKVSPDTTQQEEAEPKIEVVEPVRGSSDDKIDQSLGADIVDISEEDQRRLLTEYEEEMKKGHSRGSSGTHLSSSSSGSFAFVTHDLLTDELKIE